MSGEERRCQATTSEGSPCGAPPKLVDSETGLCPSHDPDNREALREAARKGAAASKAQRSQGRSRGLDPSELPPLEDPAAAEVWCDRVGRAVVTGRLTHNQGKAALRAVREWRESHETGRVSERLDELTEALAEWRRTGDPSPVLEIVEGGKD